MEGKLKYLTASMMELGEQSFVVALEPASVELDLILDGFIMGFGQVTLMDSWRSLP